MRLHFRSTLLAVFVAIVAGLIPANRSTAATEESSFPQILSALRTDHPVEAVRLAKPLAESGDAQAQFVLGLLGDIGAGARLNPKEALSWLEKSAAQGSAEARLYLAYKYKSGFGLDKADPDKAGEWRGKAENQNPSSEPGLVRWITLRQGQYVPNFKRAYLWMMDQAAQGNVLAEANLAFVYLETQWTRPDIGEHLLWLKSAGDHKDVPSLERLALYYELGMMVDKDPVKAQAYRQAAAEAGSADAQLALGRKYEEGDGVEVSAAEAAKWYRLAAAQENPEALNNLIALLRKGPPGVPQDFVEAAKLAEQGAERGDPDAIANLADLYNRGEGVAKDDAKAISLYSQAAAKNHVRAMEMVGFMRCEGQAGPVDFIEARRWFERAAALGSDYSERRLGLLYENGQGVEKDATKAFEWMERAARSGDAWAQNYLGWMLRQGVGIEVDYEEAMNWFRLAAKNGEALGEANIGDLYANGLGVARDRREAFAHLRIALQKADDSWIYATMANVLWGSTDPEREEIKPDFIACLDDPDLIHAAGDLPEICLAAIPLYCGKTSEERTASLLKQLATVQREQAYGELAWRSFLGSYLPYNLTQARAWANAYAKRNPAQSAFLLAAMDSLASDSAMDRDAARTKLHQLAEGGNRPAAQWLACRFAEGVGEPRDDAAAIRYYKLSVNLPAGSATETIEVVRKKLGVHPPEEPPPEAELAKKSEQLSGSAAQTAPPAAVYQMKPIYPCDLRWKNVEGNAKIEFIIDATGHTRDVRVVSATQPLFGLSAQAAVRHWYFIPGRKDGKIVSTRVAILIPFNLTDQLELPEPPHKNHPQQTSSP
jgi:TonB family protein